MGAGIIGEVTGLIPGLLNALLTARSLSEQRRIQNELLQKYEEAQTSARERNEGRYEEIKEGYEGARADLEKDGAVTAGYERQLNEIRGSGAQEATDIRQAGSANFAAATQDLTSRGLGGTTIRASERRATSAQVQGGLGRLQDRLRQQRLGVMGQQTNYYQGRQQQRFNAARDQFDFMERRQDPYPDPSVYLGLAQKYTNQRTVNV